MNDGARVIRRPIAAGEDTTFIRLSDTIVSQSIIAHVRKATVGSVTTENCHPFQYQQWLLAHNGTLEQVAVLRERLLPDLPVALRKNIRGTTDSEFCFHVFLHHMSHEFGVDLAAPMTDIDILCKALRGTIQYLDDQARIERAAVPSRLNFLITNGHVMAATRRGHPLFVLERSHQSDVTGMLGPQALQSGLSMGLRLLLEEDDEAVPPHSVLIASEPISAEPWHAVPQDSIVLVDDHSRVRVEELASLSKSEMEALERFILERRQPRLM